MLGHFRSDLLLFRLWRVLSADQNRIDACGSPSVIFHRHLRLAIGSHPIQHTFLSHAGHAAGQHVRQVYRHRHEALGFRAGKSKHHALVSRPQGLQLVVCDFSGPVLKRLIHAPGDVLALRLQRNLHFTRVAVQTFCEIVVSDLQNELARERLEVDLSCRRNFTQ